MLYRTRNGYYNTETAKEVCSWERGRLEDGTNERHALYVTRTGKFFVHSHGGINTGYAVVSGSEAAKAGERIDPVSSAEARRLIKLHGSEESYDLVSPHSPDETVRKSVVIHRDADQMLKRLAKRRGLTLSGMVESLIRKEAESVL